MPASYQQFLDAKAQNVTESGFEPKWMPDCLFPFQRHLTGWAIRNGRSALLEGCGMGKSLQELVFGENCVLNTGLPSLIATPLAVSYQFEEEGRKFGIECVRSTNGKPAGRITVTNYQNLSKFDPSDYGCFIGDEGSVIKDCEGVTRATVTDFARKLPYRLLATATPAPNDYDELGTLSDALGHLGYWDMITRFFKQVTTQDGLGWNRSKYRFRGHAEQIFWKWVCSWARVCRMPSDIGFDNGDFVLPELIEREHVIANTAPRAGMLFPVPAVGLREEREERRVSLNQRCEAMAEIAMAEDSPFVAWCQLNPEGDLLEKLIPDSVQVKGSMSDDEKEEKLLAFQKGQFKRLVTKDSITCYGLNWQHCHRTATFVTHSYERYYQLLHRFHRFGQTKKVEATIIATEGERGVLQNLRRKAKQADEMFEALALNANEVLHIERKNDFTKKAEMPTWL
jgi:hypothetical protein